MRNFFASKKSDISLPNLIDIQVQSYNWLWKEGLRDLLDEISPIESLTGKNYELTFGDYHLEKPKYDEKNARDRNLTYKANLRCQVVLQNNVTKTKKAGEVYLGEFPLMTDRGTFIINGIERVVVSQLVRSYGVLFTAQTFGDRKLFGAKIIPSRGAWLELETSNRDQITVKVDRKRKIPVTAFLRAMGGYSNEQLAKLFEDVDVDSDHPYLKTTLEKDSAETNEEALVEVYKRIRPSDLVTPESAQQFLEMMFYNFKRYDLGRVGRYKMNQRLEIDVKNNRENRVFRIEDFVAVVKEIIRLNNDPVAQPDDIDHLENRRVRAVGELIQSRMRVGFLRMERVIKDRMSVADPLTVTPAQLVNNRPIMSVIQEFFASSQLSQFMNQTNPLAELEHKRTLSSTGPGGLSRERAGFEVRDVHASHYGRICPIETPEGQNIGLVSYLATYGKINEYGFIESPYYKVIKAKNSQMKVTDEVVYLSPAQEDKVVIAPSSTELDKNNFISGKKVVVRRHGYPALAKPEEVGYLDVSSSQLVSISTALIPFLEHDEPGRASYGSNMQRQAVPLIKPEAPIVGTGLEEDAARNSGQIILSPASGVIKYVDAEKIELEAIENNMKKLIKIPLIKFTRSNQSTCINQLPRVIVGQKVSKNQLLADSNATEKGELALGKNILVAFMSFEGLNYEDAIIVSERLVREDILTSIHIEKYTLDVRDTKLGPEIITRDIPNVGEEALTNLDESGIIRIGAKVKQGDILVGKISPKGEVDLSAEEKLLRAIFGEKAKDVKDTSLCLPHGEYGTVINIKVFSKDKGDELPAGVYQAVEVTVAQMRKIGVGDKLAGRHGNKGVISKVLPVEEMPYLPDGTAVDIILNPLGVISRMNIGQLLETHLGWAAKKLGYRVAAPVFESVSFEQIQGELEKAGLPKNGKITLRDGRTGETFNEPTTVGEIYMLKLIHLVDDKMHARATGPYSMVTQQPLGGKAQFGGQRFGEMEVWALEAYGAKHTLQEMLTIKSDDVIGRVRAYESIIKNEEIQRPQIPASFYVLVRELQSLGLSVEMIKNGKVIAMDKQEDILERSAGEVRARKEKMGRISRLIEEEKKEEKTAEKVEDKITTEIAAGQEENPPEATKEEIKKMEKE